MKLPPVISLIILLTLSAGHTLADEQRRDLPPEERRELRKQMREHWEREYRGQHPRSGEKPVHWRDQPPEERRRLREEMREQLKREGGKPLSHCPKASEPNVATFSG
jgi:hypothetical protein